MKTTVRNIFLSLGLVSMLFASCQKPEELIPSDVKNGINSFTAKFPGDNSEENEFKAEIDYVNHIINVVFPYTYPANTTGHLTMEKLTNMRVSAGLDDNVIVSPALLYMDLSKPNHITVTDAQKKVIDYTVTAEIRKSNLCQVLEFNIPSHELSGVINEGTKTISLIAESSITALADVKLSFGATIRNYPNPTVDECTYSKDEPVEFVVRAQDGKTEAKYKVVVSEPELLEKGLRPGSEKMLWHVPMSEVGMSNLLMTTSMALTSDYVVFNTRGEDMFYIDRKTGKPAGSISVGFKGSLANFSCASDNADHILVANLAKAGEEWVVYRWDGVKSYPKKYLTFTTDAVIGRRFSVIGDLDGDAIITAPTFEGAPKAGFYRWLVRGGVLGEPEFIAINLSLSAAWNYNCDVIYSDPSDEKADYFLASYAGISALAGDNRAHVWMDGKTNKQKYFSKGISPNWVPNAVDVCKFNGGSYFVSNSVNSFTWGSDDMVYFYDLGNENLDQTYWTSDKGIYGAFVNCGEANANAYGDVCLGVSQNGVYMYMYFFFAGGQVGAVQFDCLKM